MENPSGHLQEVVEFSVAERDALYKAIFSRRDVRGQFKPNPVPDQVLARILRAAHHAPSVGFMQPWNFMLIRSPAIKRQVHGLFLEANREAREMFEADKRPLYSALKLEGILESPINLVVTCDRERAGPVVLGRTHDLAMDIYSSVCAVQNLWLAARAEGVGVGWVSIFDPSKLKELLNLPARVVPIAYLCVGYVEHFFTQPELQSTGWRDRLPLQDLVYFDRWGNSQPEKEGNLLSELAKTHG
ncbi:5,6-dimethylbenzimidazole synthase [Sedimenticola thiotaurini]|uniref:Cob(II)yrinic acid a,c-diamide reductase n=1 Tax=Sedimenticola thiotaurini TaxID=1543721 RepID=A0A0F7JXQ5_9GAMM|nr:5,6-dimethylbenzimidazole synthase [Sedimenticola thiotaurini]AKH19570.1 cob(II)yrinic acid a,c-diamide reductase [Sedimenticola thiotaurini]